MYSEQVLAEKLTRMNSSQQSIQTLSHWIMYHRKRSVQSVQIWEKELYKTSADRKITFLYLANDIMQSSRKKSGEFIQEFSKIIKPAIIHIYREGDSQNSVLRVLDVWQERQVLPKSFLDDIRRAFKQDSTTTPQQTIPKAETISLSTEKSPIISFPETKSTPINDALNSIQEIEITNELFEKKVHSINPKLYDESILNEIKSQKDISELRNELDSSYQLLLQYQKKLEEDIERRGNLVQILTECLEKQESMINNSSTKIQETKENLRKTELVRTKLKKLFAQVGTKRTSSEYSKQSGDSIESSTHINSNSPVSSPHTPPSTPPPLSPNKFPRTDSQDNFDSSDSQVWNPIPSYKHV